jgi:aminoglycoside/choline kinase family phosphotransferase
MTFKGKGSSLRMPIDPKFQADARLAGLSEWLARDLKFGVERIAPASVDASFRRYFRVWRGAETFIAMDAPPDKEDLGPYLTIVRMLADIGVHVPRILEEEHTRGFLLVTDLGSRQYLDDLTMGRHVETHYADAMSALGRIQSHGAEHALKLAPYDRTALEFEMNLMPEWFCGRHLRLTLGVAERVMLTQTFDALCRVALAQPQVFVHRDYHSRNLMVFPGDNPGVLDFQDAVRGPVTYDLVSLLKDCYVEWPPERVQGWVSEYRSMMLRAGVDVGRSEAEFIRWFDLMGAQRHIKVLGIFARLFHRDGKSGYLSDLPLTLKYLRAVCPKYPELQALGEFLETRVAPAFAVRHHESGGSQAKQ